MTNCETLKTAIGAVLLALVVAAASPALAAPPPPPLCPYPGQTPGCLLANPVAPLLPATQPKYVNELPQPLFYEADKTDPLFDYYEIFSAGAGLGLASPLSPFGVGSLTPAIQSSVDTWGGVLAKPVNKVWLGLVNPLVPANKLFTEVWGYGQQNNALFPLNGVATYPAMSFRATKGQPVKVMWINKLPDQHMFCKFPQNSSYPCAIDRTLMGVKGVAPFSVGPFGGTQQPDNAMVVHLHGGEIPPDSDGFAELWFGNTASAGAYRVTAPAGTVQNIDPPLLAPTTAILPAAATPPWVGNSTPTGDVLDRLTGAPRQPFLGSLIRPTGDSMIYNYPMVQEAATIWYHDHALAKTRINVAAGPAGYFYIQDPVVDTALFGGTPDSATYKFGNCTNPGILAGACRDVPIVLQDRAFNADGSINFPNGLGQIAKNKINPLTPGPNPAIHPQWVPEYFGDHAVVNGITWPKLTVTPEAYRIRFLDGSNARCYTLSIAPAVAAAAGAVRPTLRLIGSDQGYLPQPTAPLAAFTMCPGERYEAVIDFTGVAPGTVFNLVNTAGAPFPAGITPQAPNSPDKFLASMMQFVVKPAAGPLTPWTAIVNPNWVAGNALNPVKATVEDRITALLATPAPPVGPFVGVAPAPNPFTHVLNEVLDPLTKAPLRVQIDGKAYEDAVTELPKRGAVQYWDIVNTTVDAHPMHLHLVQFKVVGRWILDINKYMKAAIVPNPLTGGITVNTAVNPMAYVMGVMRPPDPGEQGFKDTARSLPGELLRVVARWDGAWADQDPVNAALTPFGKTAPACQAPLGTLNEAVAPGPTPAGCRCVQQQLCAPFDPLLTPWPVGTPLPVGNTACNCVDLVNNTTGLPGADAVCDAPLTAVWATVPPLFSCGATMYKPYFQPVTSGPYVWHCHIVDHEDNEMMRPTLVVP